MWQFARCTSLASAIAHCWHFIESATTSNVQVVLFRQLSAIKELTATHWRHVDTLGVLVLVGCSSVRLAFFVLKDLFAWLGVCDKVRLAFNYFIKTTLATRCFRRRKKRKKKKEKKKNKKRNHHHHHHVSVSATALLRAAIPGATGAFVQPVAKGIPCFVVLPSQHGPSYLISSHQDGTALDVDSKRGRLNVSSVGLMVAQNNFCARMCPILCQHRYGSRFATTRKKM